MDAHDFRLGRLFDAGSGRTMIVAFDSGLIADVSKGGDRVEQVVGAVVESGVEGILLSPGLLDRCRSQLARRGAPAALLRTDLHFSGRALPAGTAGVGEFHRTLVTAADAAAMGADGIVMFLVLGNQDDRVTADNAAAVARAAQEAHRVGLPLIVETVLWGSRIEDHQDPSALTYLNRFAAELGADAVKTQFTGEVESMKGVIANCPVPVLLLGGPRATSQSALTTATSRALASGARGLVYGRNVWQAEDPGGAARHLHKLVHATTTGSCI